MPMGINQDDICAHAHHHTQTTVVVHPTRSQQLFGVLLVGRKSLHQNNNRKLHERTKGTQGTDKHVFWMYMSCAHIFGIRRPT